MEKQFEQVVSETMNQYSEALRRLADEDRWISTGSKLLVKDVEELIDNTEVTVVVEVDEILKENRE